MEFLAQDVQDSARMARIKVFGMIASNESGLCLSPKAANP